MENDGKFRFGLVSHQTQLTDAVRNCFNPEFEEVTIKTVKMGEAVQTAKKLFNEGIEVVFAYMGTAPLILKATGKPVINIPRTRLDLIIAFRKAKKYGSQIALTSFAEPTDGMDVIEDLLDIKVHQIIFNSVAKLEQGVYSAWNQGIKVIVGGGISTKIMNDLGGQGVILFPRKSVVEQAFREARAIAADRRKELEDSVRLKTILQMIDEGVVGVDNYGKINIYNDSAEKILGLELKSLVGQSLPKIIKDMNLIDVLSSREPDLENTRKIGKTNVIVDTLPIDLDGRAKGAVAFIKDASKIQNINRKLKENLYTKGFVARHTIGDIKGTSIQIKNLSDKAKKYAKTDASIIIQGETGTGKELLAQSIHNLSDRKNKPFVAFNCAALPESLLESELFGYEEGAFTGAKKGGKIGLFELANHGTVFLDEIADIPSSLQIRLLRVIETKEVMRVGGDKYVPVDVRIVSSSYKNLRYEVKVDKFRADLYFRLAVLKLKIPALRERFEDIPLIIQSLLGKYNKGKNAVTSDMIDGLKTYDWPGNIRELISFMESYLILLDKEARNRDLFFSLLSELTKDIVVSEKHEQRAHQPLMGNNTHFISEKIRSNGSNNLKEMLKEYEGEIINEALKSCQHNKTDTAKRLGISVNTLWRKMQCRKSPQ